MPMNISLSGQFNRYILNRTISQNQINSIGIAIRMFSKIVEITREKKKFIIESHMNRNIRMKTRSVRSSANMFGLSVVN